MPNWKKIDADQLDADLTAIADAIRSKTGSIDPVPFDQMAQEIAGISAGGNGGYDEGYADGVTEADAKNAAENAVILDQCNAVFPEKGVDPADSLADVPGQIGKIEPKGEDLFQSATGLNNLFEGATFPEGYELTVNAPALKNGVDKIISYAKNIKKFTLKGNTANNALSCQYAFRVGNMLEVIDLTGLGVGGIKPSYLNSAFSGNSKLVSILGEIDFSMAVNISSSFADCTALVDVRFKAGTLSKSLDMKNCRSLSDESIQSIIDGLADLSGATAQTLTLHATAGGKLTDAQKTAAAAKNWTLAY